MAARTTRGPAILEAGIQKAVTEFLQLDGWRAFRTEHAIERNAKGGFKRRVGEVGMPDQLYIRYTYFGISHTSGLRSVAEVMWIEFKAPSRKPRIDQLAWHETEAKQGALVLVVNSIDKFLNWYAVSGLQRRVSTRKTG